jgi:hypothetical protein
MPPRIIRSSRSKDMPCPSAAGHIFIIVFSLSLLIASGFLNADAGETNNYSLEFKNGSLKPSSELTLIKGAQVTFNGTDEPLRITIKNAKDSVELPSFSRTGTKGDDLILTLTASGKVAIRFINSGDFRFRIDGLNPDQHAYKCGVDVLPHFVEGIIHVKD